MISGVIQSNEARIIVTVMGPQGQEHEVHAVIDTGFSGFLTLPPAVIERFGGKQVGTANVYLADGSKSISDIFELTIHWDGQSLVIEVDSAEIEPLVGMALLAGHDLQMRVIPNGEVTIRSVLNDT